MSGTKGNQPHRESGESKSMAPDSQLRAVMLESEHASHLLTKSRTMATRRLVRAERT
jgi:hypothetical protein